jgi:hypothetical protein
VIAEGEDFAADQRADEQKKRQDGEKDECCSARRHRRAQKS